MKRIILALALTATQATLQAGWVFFDLNKVSRVKPQSYRVKPQSYRVNAKTEEVSALLIHIPPLSAASCFFGTAAPLLAFF